VVSAGNLGPGAGTISKPADDPLVITVGAIDDRESPGTSDDRLPSFSARGPAFPGTPDEHVKPDVVAPGGNVISLRVGGSFVEQHAPGGLPHQSYRRGSGTSMAAGVTSGAIALMLQANPAWRGNPDRVKFALAATARKVAERFVYAIGAGLIDVYAATRSAPAGVANGWVTASSDGSGSLDGSRADVLVSRVCAPFEQSLNPTCDHVNGENTGQDRAFDSEQFRGTWNEASWYRSQWVTGLTNPQWYGSSWYGSSWYGSSWYGSSWYGSTDGTFYGVSVAGSSWYGAWN
ncbi:MAG TPA: S8 family serine peptidase, partial [Actinomycetota bacterium]|nr:S8 family serine peptidase [Actinomycetota bacterium]